MAPETVPSTPAASAPRPLYAYEALNLLATPKRLVLSDRFFLAACNLARPFRRLNLTSEPQTAETGTVTITGRLRNSSFFILPQRTESSRKVPSAASSPFGNPSRLVFLDAPAKLRIGDSAKENFPLSVGGHRQ